MIRHSTLRPLLLVTAAVAAVLAAAPGLAEEAKPESALPGVDQTYSIVTPEPDEPAEKENGPIKVGQWELTVSGYVWVQFGSGSHGDGR
jgi:hypothetical protein